MIKSYDWIILVHFDSATESDSATLSEIF